MKLNLLGPINTLGYGYTALNITKALINNKVELSLFPIGQPQVYTQEDASIVKQCMETAKFFDCNAPCIKIWHQNDMAQFAGKGKHIGFPIFELDTFNNIEKHHLQSCDSLFVCSEWAKDILYNHKNWTSPRVDVIPLGVDTSLFKPSDINTSSDTIFFNCGKWEVRKGHPELIKAFTSAFEPTDKVQLWLMCDNPFNSEEENAQWYSLFNTTKHYENGLIKLIPRVATHHQVYNIMSQTDCGVFPSRAEGWNLEAIEMLACGKHLIITDYSAHTEFCNKENSLLIPIKEKELAFDNKWFFCQGSWAKLETHELDVTIEHMRNVHRMKQNNELALNTRGVETANKFSWNNSAKRIIECLSN